MGTPERGLSLYFSKFLSISSALFSAESLRLEIKIFNLSFSTLPKASCTASLADIFLFLKFSLCSLKFILLSLVP